MTAAWVVLVVLFGVGAATMSGPSEEGFSIPGTESSRAMDVISAKMNTGSGDTASANVVFTAGDLAGAGPRTAIEGALTELRALPDVAAVSDLVVAEDRRTAYATVAYDVPVTDLADDAREQLIDAGRSAEPAGIGVEFSGSAAQEAGETPAGEVLGVLVAALVLVLTFSSLVAAGLPLLTALIGVGLGMLGIRIATGFFDLSATTSTLALMLGLAVGIDYALFVLSRYRHELRRGRSGEDAAGHAIGTAGSAVVFAGLTVVIALAALSVVGISFLTSMGLAAAGTVAVAVLISLTLLPALLGFAGNRVLPRRARTGRPPAGPEGRRPLGERWARSVVTHRVGVVLAATGLLVLTALPALDLRLALPDEGTAPVGTTQRTAYDQLSEGFGAGFNGPLVVLVEAEPGRAAAAADQAGATLRGLDDVVAVTPPTVNPAGDTALLTVVPGSGPSAAETTALVETIRAQPDPPGATLAVTGPTALGIDVSDKLTDALVPYLTVVVGLAFLLLMLVFRSLAVPLKATVGFLLSIAATFGATVAVFQWGWLAGLLGVDTTAPIVSIMPIFLIGILFGLAMDYEVFLVTRAREEFVHGATPDAAVISGVSHGARVVSAAAIIMICVFAGFVLSDEPIIKSLGFALAFGVAVDAFVVRMTIVPAVLSLLGRAAWWLPRPLDRWLPNVDVEGARLTVAEEPSPVAVRV
ncbi:putative RND superfamily drug exporter [Cryptosporangium arvum DSM 44712]|uniref:Putative RND superfamily drug exporter n=2 Tax=Cryptosporangium TaxID=65502 RepID=A0A011ALW8_9ACTN|nr:putative RND superfamily drug exporter [Cryptosporangium arvum DSM 44712]